MKSYINAIKSFADFKGTMERREYFTFVLFDILFLFLLSVIERIIFGSDYNLLTNLYSLIVFLPRISANVRRLHDVGRSGWWIFVPVVNVILLIQKRD